MRKSRDRLDEHTVHLYVTQNGLMSLLKDIEAANNTDGVVVTSGGRNNCLIGVWITARQYASLVNSDLQAKYGSTG